MKIFISWSGPVSKRMALILRDWLPNVIQAIEKPFVSEEDIKIGARWLEEIGSQLKSADFGIICVTPNNMNELWLLFEAGALSNQMDNAYVAPILRGLSNSDLTGPLEQFQNAVMIEKTQINKLLVSINSQLENGALDDTVLSKNFEKWWPDLEREFNSIQEVDSNTEQETRKPEDMLEEILLLTRSNAQQLANANFAMAIKNYAAQPPPQAIPVSQYGVQVLPHSGMEYTDVTGGTLEDILEKLDEAQERELKNQVRLDGLAKALGLLNDDNGSK